MKICVVTQDYPSSGRPDTMAFTHARNILYKNAGHEVSVLNFSAHQPYAWDGIQVYPEAAFDRTLIANFDVFVFHSPNIRNHLRFMLKGGKAIKASVFVSHGFEFIDWFRQNALVYDFQKSWKSALKLRLVQAYDDLKLKVWASYFRSLKGQGPVLVFVSDWLKEMASRCLKLDLDENLRSVEVISNPVHPVFIQNRFDSLAPKVADFVAIRNFDDPKYAVDILVEIVRRNPQYSFHLFGDGEYFEHNSAPKNLTVIRRKFKQSEIPALFNQYRAAILPTRWDSQGVMMCEAATFGIPTVVSDLPICRHMVGEFPNVDFFDNDDPKVLGYPVRPAVEGRILRKFAAENTVDKELRLFENIRTIESVPQGGRVLSALLYLANRFYQLVSRPDIRGAQSDVTPDAIRARAAGPVSVVRESERIENPSL